MGLQDNFVDFADLGGLITTQINCSQICSEHLYNEPKIQQLLDVCSINTIYLISFGHLKYAITTLNEFDAIVKGKEGKEGKERDKLGNDFDQGELGRYYPCCNRLNQLIIHIE